MRQLGSKMKQLSKAQLKARIAELEAQLADRNVINTINAQVEQFTSNSEHLSIGA